MTATTARPSIKARALAAYERQREQHAEAEAERDKVKLARLTEALAAELQRLDIGPDEYEVLRGAKGAVYALIEVDEQAICVMPNPNGYAVQVGAGPVRTSSTQNFWANLGAWLTEG